MTSDGDLTWSDSLRVAVLDFDWSAVAAVVERYVDHLRSTEGSVDLDEASQMLGLLRGVRRYAEIQTVADALLGHGLKDAFIRRQLAQSFVDRDNPAAARLVYQGILDDPATPGAELTEALGGVGRCSKQLYLLDRVTPRRAQHMNAALRAYRQAYDADHAHFWHGINLVAMLARAGRDEVEVEGTPDPLAASAQLAHEVLATVLGPRSPDVWELATACEAGVALGDHDLAISRATMLVSRSDVDAFTVASLLRQLLELWELTTDELPGQILVPLLRSAVLGRDGGSVVVDPRDARTGRSAAISDYKSTTGQSLEKVLGHERFQGMHWWLTGLDRCRAVARIENTFSDAIGTGFLVGGKQLSPVLPDLVLVTNGHVVPEDLPYDQARVVFHGLTGDSESVRRRFEIVRWWWYQPSKAPGLDVTLLELDAYPAEVTPIPLAERMPRLGARTPPRAYVIGHPLGWDTPQFSLQDNLLIDYDDRLVHYRSPTEPGSSGSPVFDGTWSLIAVHHAGGLEMPKLHEAGGTYPANEGISVAALRAELEQQPPRGQDVSGLGRDR